MIPIRNRRKTLQVTVDEMRSFAFAYVEKYAPSKQQPKYHNLRNVFCASPLIINSFFERIFWNTRQFTVNV